jgi:hypothetical protein
MAAAGAAPRGEGGVTARRAPGVVAAVRRDMRRLAVELRDSAEAAAAVELAKTMDQGMHIATCSKELRAVMSQLRAADAALGRVRQVEQEQAEAASKQPARRDAGIADLTARIDAARRGASAG